MMTAQSCIGKQSNTPGLDDTPEWQQLSMSGPCWTETGDAVWNAWAFGR